MCNLNINRQKGIIISAFLVITGFCYAQNNGVKMIASPRRDSIMLRWAPTNAATWQLANEYGYMVTRVTITRRHRVVKQVTKTRLTDEPIKPQPLKNWEPYANDKYVAVAAECIFNPTYTGVPTGTNPFAAYQQYKETQHRFGFALYAADQSLKVAELSGLYFVDRSAMPDEKYLYRVYICSPDSLAVDTASVFTGISDYAPLPKPLELTAEWGDKNVELSWNCLYLKPYYNAYVVEKSTDKGKTYRRVSDLNTLQLAAKGINTETGYFSDTLANNTDTLYYRIRGITAFGELSPPSDSVFGKGCLPLTGAPVFIQSELIHNHFIRIAWIYPDDMNDHISGFVIYRSTKPKGKKQAIYRGNDPAAREFTDSAPGMTNYYLIAVYNAHEQKLSPYPEYVQRIDSFPPKAPKGFTGFIDSTGVAHLGWQPNTDDDLAGYRIYRANNPTFEFALINPSVISDTAFVDTVSLKVLNKYIYYRLKAVDVRDNLSAFSPILALKRPDIIAPVPPVLKTIALAPKGKAEITWVNSSSDDVVAHKVYRKQDTDTAFTAIARLDKQDAASTTFTDKTVKPGHKYTYYICAVDDSRLVSHPSHNGYLNMPPGKPETMRLKKKVYTDRVKLSWVLEMDKPPEKVLVYRSVNHSSMQLLGYSETGEFTDNRLAPEKDYSYCIKVIFTDGTSSALSKPVMIKM